MPNLALIVGGTFLVMLFSLVLPAYGTLFSIIMPAKARTVGFAITRLWVLPGLVIPRSSARWATPTAFDGAWW